MSASSVYLGAFWIIFVKLTPSVSLRGKIFVSNSAEAFYKLYISESSHSKTPYVLAHIIGKPTCTYCWITFLFLSLCTTCQNASACRHKTMHENWVDKWPCMLAQNLGKWSIYGLINGSIYVRKLGHIQSTIKTHWPLIYLLTICIPINEALWHLMFLLSDTVNISYTEKKIQTPKKLPISLTDSVPQ